MSTAERIHVCLAQDGRGAVCDDCITKGTGLSSRQQVHPVTTAFGLTRDFERGQGLCSECKVDRLATEILHDAGK